MKRFAVLCLLALPVAAHAGPRDAAAVLNRCGKPLKGDTTIFENTVAGGRRILSYERATLNFNRVENDGWTFISGEHGKLKGLTPAETERYMPCIEAALADSASPEPLKTITPIARVETSVKAGYKKLILWSLGAVALLGILLFSLPRRTGKEDV